MSNAAPKINETQREHGAPFSLLPANSDVTTADSNTKVLLIALVLIALQILDGILTLSGAVTFGLAAEGNPILRQLMHSIGLIPALLVTKIGCIGLVIILCLQAPRICWLPRALTVVAGIYTIGAIVPWSIILISEYLG
jgi:hypothetical protein